MKATKFQKTNFTRKTLHAKQMLNKILLDMPFHYPLNKNGFIVICGLCPSIIH